MNLDANTLQQISKVFIIALSIASFVIVSGANERVKQGISALKAQRKNEDTKEINIIILPSRFHDNVEKQLKNPRAGYFNYERMDAFLKKNGAGFLSSYFENPVNFIFIKCAIALVIGLFCMILGGGTIECIGLGVVGFFALDYIIHSENKSDNKEMLDDIHRATETIRMYGESSGTFYNAIFECYKFTKNKRLKRGLFELYGELQMTHSYELAIEHFLGKFNNPQVTAFGRNVEQIGTTGFNEALISDISRDMLEMQKEINYNYKNHLETRWSVIMVVTFIIMLALCIYGMIGDFSISSFSG